jgi:hypothetical protein
MPPPATLVAFQILGQELACSEILPMWLNGKPMEDYRHIRSCLTVLIMPLLANLNAPAFPLQDTHILLHDARAKQFGKRSISNQSPCCKRDPTGGNHSHMNWQHAFHLPLHCARTPHKLASIHITTKISLRSACELKTQNPARFGPHL